MRGAARIVGAALLAAIPLAVPAQNSVTKPAIQIYAGPLHRDYLGCLNCDQFDPLSIWDNYGAFGLDNAYPDMSRYAEYRKPHGRYSACDAYAGDPPILIDNARKNYGVFSTSETRADSICGPHGDTGLCSKLKAMCARQGQPG